MVCAKVRFSLSLTEFLEGLFSYKAQNSYNIIENLHTVDKKYKFTKTWKVCGGKLLPGSPHCTLKLRPNMMT